MNIFVYGCTKLLELHEKEPFLYELLLCFQIPQEKKYAGISNRHKCICGDGNYDVNGKSDDCDIPCLGNSSQICGGSDETSVYLAGITEMSE